MTKKHNFGCFLPPHAASPNKSQKSPPGALPGGSGELPGTPRDPEIDRLFASGGPRGAPNQFFGLPGPPPRAIWSAPGTHFGRTWRPRAPQRRPRGPQEAPGAKKEASGEQFCFFFSCYLMVFVWCLRLFVAAFCGQVLFGFASGFS